MYAYLSVEAQSMGVFLLESSVFSFVGWQIFLSNKHFKNDDQLDK